MGMNETVPTTAKEFEAWFHANRDQWPQELQDAATRALLSLKVMNQVGFEQSPALQQSVARDLMNFAAAWAKR